MGVFMIMFLAIFVEFLARTSLEKTKAFGDLIYKFQTNEPINVIFIVDIYSSNSYLSKKTQKVLLQCKTDSEL